jgi:hypothetical protein
MATGLSFSATSINRKGAVNTLWNQRACSWQNSDENCLESQENIRLGDATFLPSSEAQCKVQQSWGEWFLHARRNDRGLTETPHGSLRGLMRIQNLHKTASDSGTLENLAGIGVLPVLDCHLGRVGKADRYIFAAEPIRLITAHTPHAKAFSP